MINVRMDSKYTLVFTVLGLVRMSDCQVQDSTFEPNHPGVNSFDSYDDTVDSFTFLDSPPYRYVTPESIEGDVPVILWWTGRLFPEPKLQQTNCPTSVCYSTRDRSFLNDPRTFGLYFYGTDLDPEDLPIPRKPHHEWALYHEESPMNNYMLIHSKMLELFNHTATFRRESDYPLTSSAIPHTSYLLDRKPVSIEDKNQARKDGFAPVLFIQSHCNVASDRERYVKELMQHIEVDSIGACLHNKDIPDGLRNPVETMDSPELFDMVAKYKFHLAFENAICKDYMTEKLFRPLHVGSVPVYRGSSLARDWMPDNHTIIMADDFSNPEELAKFIKDLDENDEEYEKYLQFKTKGISNKFLLKNLHQRQWGLNERGKPDSLIAFECYICDQLTERYKIEKLHRSNPDITLLPRKMANSSHMNCPQPYPAIGNVDDLPWSDSWRDQFWIEDYWGGLDKAQAVHQMIENNEKDPASFSQYWESIMQKRPFGSESERFRP